MIFILKFFNFFRKVIKHNEIFIFDYILNLSKDWTLNFIYWRSRK